MPDKVSENLMFVLDTSRSMYRTDYSANRLEACKSGILSLIAARMKHDQSTSFGLITFSESADVIFDVTENAKHEEFQESLKDIKCGGISSLGEGIGKAIKLLIEDIRRAGAKVPRILVFSDGKFTQSKVDPMKMAQLSQQLGIKIDCFRLGEVEHFNVMKRLSEITEGKYFYSNDSSTLLKTAVDVGESNVDAHGAAYQKGKNYTNVLKQIAAPLMTESEMNQGDENQKDLIAKLRGTKTFSKCSVCFSDTDPITKTAFNISGRYCPNCATPLHMSCASMWAKSNNKESDGTILRCPHCFYLIKVPAAIQAAAKLHQEVKQDIKTAKASEPQTFLAKKVVAKTLGESALYSACPVCSGIFDENEIVIKCGNPRCNGIYHESCFSQLTDGVCRTCGSKFSSNM